MNLQGQIGSERNIKAKFGNSRILKLLPIFQFKKLAVHPLIVHNYLDSRRVKE